MHELVSQLAELEAKFFGKFLKSKDITQVKTEIANAAGQISDELNSAATTVVLQDLEESIKIIDEYHDRHSFFTKDYILAGSRSCPVDDILSNAAKLTSLQFAETASVISTLSGKAFQRHLF